MVGVEEWVVLGVGRQPDRTLWSHAPEGGAYRCTINLCCGEGQEGEKKREEKPFRSTSNIRVWYILVPSSFRDQLKMSLIKELLPH